MQQWVKKMKTALGLRSVSQQAEKKTGSAEVGTTLGPVNLSLHQDRVRVQRQKRRFTTICSVNCFIIPLVGSSIPQILDGIN